jgi:DNA repair exonuclease SbcCD ATPase subunit
MVLDVVPQKELKTGTLKEEIDISIVVSGRRVNYWGLSDGQRQKVNISLLLALYKLCKERGVNPFDFMLLDEVLDLSLSEGGCSDVITLLHDINHEIHTIVVISHKDSIKNDFAHLVDVYRSSDGISVIN